MKRSESACSAWSARNISLRSILKTEVSVTAVAIATRDALFTQGITGGEQCNCGLFALLGRVDSQCTCHSFDSVCNTLFNLGIDRSECSSKYWAFKPTLSMCPLPLQVTNAIPRCAPASATSLYDEAGQSVFVVTNLRRRMSSNVLDITE
jgi:hypothetical protein